MDVNGEWHPIYTFSGDGLYEIENVVDTTIKEYKFNNGSMAAIISFTIYTPADNLMDEKICTLEKQTQTLLEYRKKDGQHLIGAIYYDGWSNKSVYAGTDSHSQTLYEASPLPGKAAFADWCDYVKASDGSYPPKDCSFSMYYPQYAPVGYQNQPSRKPYWGWRRDSVADIEQEIELAAAYGIDYFMFCFYPRDCFRNSDELDEEALRNGICNNAIYLFLQASNKSKVKFCVMIENDSGISNPTQLKNLIRYVAETFFSDSSYLNMNGAPVIGLYSWGLEDTRLDDSYRVGGCKLISNRMLAGADGQMWYSGIKTYEPYGLFCYDSLSSLNSRMTSYFARYGHACEILCIPVLAGWDNRARQDFSSECNDDTARSYQKPTKEEFFQALVKAIRSAAWAGGTDQSILIYAWSEFGEGGYLPPHK